MRIDCLKSLIYDFEVNLGKPFRILYNSSKLIGAAKIKKNSLKKIYVDNRCQRLLSHPDGLYKEIVSLYSKVMNQQNLDKLTDKMAEF